MQLKLYGYGITRSIKVAWTLEELSLDYEFIQVHPGHPPKEFVHLNPYRKVPVLSDNGHVIFETMAICTYLCDRYASESLIPKAGTMERAIHDQWMSVIQTELEPALWLREKHSFVFPKEYRLPQVNRSVEFDVRKMLGPLNDHLSSRKWMLGDRFSLVDVFLCYCLNWANAYSWVESSVLQSYLEEGQRRNGFRRARSKTEAKKD